MVAISLLMRISFLRGSLERQRRFVVWGFTIHPLAKHYRSSSLKSANWRPFSNYCGQWSPFQSTLSSTAAKISTSLFSSASSVSSSSSASSPDASHGYESNNNLTQDDPSTDTIFALSSGFTGEKATAVAVIRISGPRAHVVLQDLLKSPSSSNALPKPRFAALKKLYHPVDGTILDHALVLLFAAPYSFTGENLVELHCHGSRAVVQRMLMEILPSLGCRLAEPGEFTQRAFEQVRAKYML
jgi:tRNA modification GTPase